ncbi:MAG: hypothetical protein MJA83_04285 [Gammaproteobacteria bacterium]|nr:hypothetical protein [Gammaproteobacteria bacterium]
MQLKGIKSALLLSICAVFFHDACADNAMLKDTENRKYRAMIQGKPQAPIRIKSDVSKDAAVGAEVTITFTLMPAVDAESLELILSSGEGLNLLTQSEKIAFGAVKAGETLVHALKAVPQGEGRFYINAVAMMQYAEGRRGKAHSVAVSTGEQAPLKSSIDDVSTEVDATGTRIKKLPARTNSQ